MNALKNIAARKMREKVLPEHRKLVGAIAKSAEEFIAAVSNHTDFADALESAGISASAGPFRNARLGDSHTHSLQYWLGQYREHGFEHQA